MKKLLLFPFNGNTLEALDCLGSSFTAVAFIDDSKEKQGRSVAGIPVLGREALDQFPDAQVLAAPGSPQSFREREKIIGLLNITQSRWATVVHPKAAVSSLARIGHNVLIMAGVVVTSNAKIGSHVCVLPNSVLHHDVTIEDYSMIGSGVVLASDVRVDRGSYIASGSKVKNGVEIGAKALVGMGSVVVRSVPSESVVAGNPARPLKERNAGS